MSKAIIFDLDGTLVDSCAICITILEGMLRDRGVSLSIDPDVARPLMSRGGELMVATLLGDHCGNPAQELAEFRARYTQIMTPDSSLFDGVFDGLAKLRDCGFTMAICSNKPQALCEKVLADTGLADHFSVVVGGMAPLNPKPAPDLLEKTLADLGIAVTDCIFVGDSELDHAVAEQAGMPFHFMTYGYAEAGWEPTIGLAHDHFDQLVQELAQIRLAAEMA
ncbi:HAD family hydrolase [Novosphingobium sp. B 225]|uniref:HAD family hydrolase n=1 Tax=Novosphingobium sp. B 225 TaxID=1961849 RepID=UPI001594E7E2|nr:HAD-IA family hydrolase [Novosphingobium sp. B 225]